MGSGSSKQKRGGQPSGVQQENTAGKLATNPRQSTKNPRPIKVAKGPATRAGAEATAKPHIWERASTSDAAFDKYLRTVFKRADQDSSGLLDKDEIRLVLFSPKLGLNLSEEEAQAVITEYDVSNDGQIDYAEFSAMLRHLLKMVQSKVDDPVNDWACVEDPDGKGTVYINKRTGKTQKARPMTFNPSRVEYVVTRHITVADGSTVTVRTNDETRLEEYIDFETGEWRPFNPDDFAPPAPLEYKGIPITFEVGDVWRAYAEDLENAPYQKYCVPLLSLLEVDTNLQALCDDLTEDFPDLKGSRLVLAIAATISGYDYDSAKEFITANSLSEHRALSRHATEDELLSSQKIEALQKATADLRKDRDRLADQSADATAKVNQLTEQNRMLTERCNELRTWQIRHSKGGTPPEELASGTVDAVSYAALESEVTSLRAEVERLKSTATAKDEAAAAAVSAARSASLDCDAGDRAATGDAHKAAAAAAAAAVAAELQALKEENEKLRKEKMTADRALLASQQALNSSSGDSKALSHKMRMLMKEVKRMQTLTDAVKSDAVAMVDVVKPLMKASVAETRALSVKFMDANREVMQKYIREAALRRKYYNEIQELKGNIRVFLRVRKDTRDKGNKVFHITSESETMVQNPDPDKKPFRYEFAKVYGPDSTQEQVFADTKDTLMSVVDGYNVCIMAYGQTGSGKTFTMMGPKENPGVNRRAIAELVERLQASQADGDILYKLEASQLEVYNEGIYDLLNMGKREETKIKPRVIGKVVSLPELTWRDVENLSDVEKVMEDGDKNRTTAATAMNTASSRSHLLLQLRVTVTHTVTKKQARSLLTLVDLAGSERVSKSEVSGNGLVEAAAINKSLSSLGQVFLSLSTGERHVPYRNSALTTVLAESLGGNAKCCMFANTSPLESNLGESISTLKFASAITKIELGRAKASRVK